MLTSRRAWSDRIPIDLDDQYATLFYQNRIHSKRMGVVDRVLARKWQPKWSFASWRDWLSERKTNNSLKNFFSDENRIFVTSVRRKWVGRVCAWSVEKLSLSRIDGVHRNKMIGFFFLTFASVAPWTRWPNGASGYFPVALFKSHRAAIVNSAEYGGSQSQRERISFLKSLYLRKPSFLMIFIECFFNFTSS